MEQTLGKRIVHHRKKLGLTQDQLAEQLGVTAQAVSKWENDQSCPDITMLPKLASIFGITTDMLLGSAPEETVTASQVTVEDSRNEDDDGFISYNGSFGDDRQYVALPLLTGGEICTSFGDFTIDLSGVEAVSDGCKLVVNGSFGDTTVLVPRKFTVKASTSASFADVSVNGHPDPESQGTILVEANASFGDISIRYI